MLEVLYATGLRVSELITLDLDAVNLSVGFLKATGKGSKQRLVPLGAVAVKKFRRYLDRGCGTLLKHRSSNRVFVTRSGRGMTRQGFWKIVKRYARAAGIDHSLAANEFAGDSTDHWTGKQTNDSEEEADESTKDRSECTPFCRAEIFCAKIAA